MIHLQLFEEFSNITIKECPKSKEAYDLVEKYLNPIKFESYINNEDLYQICAYDGDSLVGVSIFRMKDGKMHITYDVVDESHRNMGINRKMKLRVIEIAKENGCTLITANVRESNLVSLKSHQNLGFKINHKVQDLKYKNGEKKIPLYLYI